MSWGTSPVANLMKSLAAFSSNISGKPGNWNRRKRAPSQPRDKTRKDAAGTSWDCTTCSFDQFGNRFTAATPLLLDQDSPRSHAVMQSCSAPFDW
eukprot:6451441-Amphidinium_carterae.1